MSTANSHQTANRAKASQYQQSRGVFWEARTRILLWYAALMAVFIGLSVPIFYKLAFDQVEARVREDLFEDLEAFEKFVEQQNSTGDKLNEEDLPDFFETFLSRKIPEDDTFLIAIIDGQFYRSSPKALPEPIKQNSELMNRWRQLTQKEKGEQKTPDPTIGNVLYLAEPVTIDGQVRGVFVAAHTTAGELQEVMDSRIIFIKILFVVPVLALILAWVASGKILAPLRSLTQAARQISETDLKQRIPVVSQGEMGELAMTFNTMMDRLQAAFDSQRDFVNDAGHELRTPITIIRGHLELLEDDPQERQETIELVIDELDRMSRFVDDLIFLAKSERPDFLQLETVDLEQLTEELYAKAKVLASRNWQLETKGKGLIVADRQRITQAIVNLAENATQHTTEADTIVLGSAIEGYSARFWVRDTGTGIDKSDQQRIFKRFARAAKTRRCSQGAGLGLSIVQAIAEAHGGWIELISEPGTGSTFTLVLPLDSPKGLSITHKS